MIRRINSAVIAGGLLITSLALSGVADAAYFGLIRRSECGSSLVPRRVDRVFWDYNLCNGVVTDAGNPTALHMASLSIPAERAVAPANVTFTGQAFGGANTSQVCFRAYVYTPAGNLSTMGANLCTVGFAPASQQVPIGALMLPVDGAMFVSVSAKHGGMVKLIAASWLANGL